MSTEENKAVVVRHIQEVYDQGRVDLIDSYYAPDGSVPGMNTPEQLRDQMLWFHKACPDFKVTILDIMAEGDKVMDHIQFDLTYTVPPDPPPSYPFPPLGKPVSWRSMHVYRIVDGKMVSDRAVIGWTDMLVEIGVIPLEKIDQMLKTS